MENPLKKNPSQRPTYDRWLHWYITMRCNFHCSYCFCNPVKHKAKLKPVDIEALTATLDRTEKKYLISFTGGGEPFLVPNFISLCKQLTEKHVIAVNTNLSSKKIQIFADMIQPEKVEYINTSLHINELERYKLLKVFKNNVVTLKKNNFNITVNVVAHPALKNKISDYKKEFADIDVKVNAKPFIGKFNNQLYPAAYTPEEKDFFNFKKKAVKKVDQKNKLCNAGFNVGVITPDGSVWPCLHIHKKLGHIYKGITFSDYLIRCPAKFCFCPLNVYNKQMFAQAIRKSAKEKKYPFFSSALSKLTTLIKMIR